MSSVLQLIDIDINTVTKEELTFSTTFSITAKRNDFIHALVRPPAALATV